MGPINEIFLIGVEKISKNHSIIYDFNLFCLSSSNLKIYRHKILISVIIFLNLNWSINKPFASNENWIKIAHIYSEKNKIIYTKIILFLKFFNVYIKVSLQIQLNLINVI